MITGGSANTRAVVTLASWTLAMTLGATAVRGQEAAAGPAAAAQPSIAATVNGDPIFVSEVDSGMLTTVGRRQLTPEATERGRAKVLDQLIKRLLCLQAIERAGTYFEPGEIDREFKRIADRVDEQGGMTVEDFARSRGVSVDKLRRELIWRLGWGRYLDRHLANAMEDYFNKHRKDLDGTEIRASHIVLRPQQYNETQEQITARAEAIRNEITSGKISFEDAAKKYSQGPSRQRGGDLGYMPRRGAMVDPFAEAAFALDQGTISEPVVTAFGTHLIRVTEIKPGTREWTQVIPQIKALANGDLFEELAAEELPNAKIEYTDKSAHFEPGTEKVVGGDTQQTTTP